MTQKTITQAMVGRLYPAVARLTDARLPAKKAFQIYKLAKKFRDLYEFAISEEKKIVDSLSGMIGDDGMIKFANQEDYVKFQDSITELHQVDIDIEFEPVILTEDDIVNLNITAADISTLEEFVIFE